MLAEGKGVHRGVESEGSRVTDHRVLGRLTEILYKAGLEYTTLE